jgi:hypothetical protein
VVDANSSPIRRPYGWFFATARFATRVRHFAVAKVVAAQLICKRRRISDRLLQRCKRALGVICIYLEQIHSKQRRECALEQTHSKRNRFEL